MQYLPEVQFFFIVIKINEFVNIKDN